MTLTRILARRTRSLGFTLIELMIAGSVIAVIGMAGVAYVGRASQGADYARDRLFARQKALSILSELRGYVEGGVGEVAADLDGFDDGVTQNPTLSIAPDPMSPGQLVPADNPISGNVLDQGEWRWFRQITVRRFPGVITRDLRLCTVRVFRHRPGTALPGETMADVSSVVRTVGDSYPTTQVYDVYLLALESVPGWWVYMSSIKPFIDATLLDLEARNPGLSFRAHWITTAGYGRDEMYSPYTNEKRITTDNTPWAYQYPGTLPTGSAAGQYYVPDGIRAHMNLDGEWAPTFSNGISAGEAFVDGNGTAKWEEGEVFTDSNGNGIYDPGNPYPYAMSDQFNHAMRWPDENAKFNQRTAAGEDADDTPTWRLLLDRMIENPAAFHNAIFINLHGELLPMPACRNYSDAAKDPASHPGWRVVAHPELLRPRRTAGSDALSDVPRWRVYAYKTEFPTAEQWMTLREPWKDLNKNGTCDAGEPYLDWNGDGKWSDHVPATIEIPGIDCSANVNGAANPTLLVKRLPGGIDANGDAVPDVYGALANAPTFPEKWTDVNGDSRRNLSSPYFDQNGNGAYDAGEPFVDRDGSGVRQAATEPFTDNNANARFDLAAPADVFTDSNGNGTWDAGEPFLDDNGDKIRNGPTVAVPPVWRAWNPLLDDATPGTRSTYCANYGEPFTDINGNAVYNGPEPLLYDSNGNGAFDGGYARGEMWRNVWFDGAKKATVVELYGTPLLTPETSDGRGLSVAQRLYDLEYIPCPMINAAVATNPPFERDLANVTVGVPKNTARWTIEIPLAQVRKGFETVAGSNNGDTTDRILEVDTRIGTDRTTGVMWPTANHPENLSKAYSYFHAATTTVPYSERFQFQGDPRHCPYADLDRYGTTSPNGYNWYFDNFNTSGNATANWLAFDAARMKAGWLGRQQIDTPRYFQWLRTALTKSEAVYTTLTGFSYYYLSVGGDVGYDSANGFATSIPVDGTPFGQTTDIFEDTIANGGTAGIGIGQKYVRSNDGTAANGIRTGGYWWSKPWLGELYQDAAYAGQWAPWGNLRAAASTSALQYQQILRGSIATAQQPAGTLLGNRNARTNAEGCTSLFNIGASGATFHHQYQDGQSGTLIGDGPQLAANYNFPIPTSAPISRPFGLAAAADGGVGDEFTYTTEYPHYVASTVCDYFNHTNGQKGSALIRLAEPGASPRAAFIVVNGIDRTTGSGSAFISRYSLTTLVHSFLAAGISGTGRIQQLPRMQILSPTIVTELYDPATIPVSWKTEWKRWDGLPYTTGYAGTFTESEANLAYLLIYSKDGGRTWFNVKNDAPEISGVLPKLANGSPNPLRTIADGGVGNEGFVWGTPAAKFPEGSYILRIEGYRTNESLHFVQHQEKIYVNR